MDCLEVDDFLGKKPKVSPVVQSSSPVKLSIAQRIFFALNLNSVFSELNRIVQK